MMMEMVEVTTNIIRWGGNNGYGGCFHVCLKVGYNHGSFHSYGNVGFKWWTFPPISKGGMKMVALVEISTVA